MLNPARGLLLVLLAGLVIGPLRAAAQPADTTQLPEIAPREIEIRGEREIDLPSLERQPLTGFASPPKVPPVPADHQPYVGSYRQSLDDLPESLPVPETVSPTMRPAAKPAGGFLEAGTGRYFERFLEGRVGIPLSSTERLSVFGKYTGTEADPNDDVAEVHARLESQQDGVRLTAEAYGSLQRYALYGASLPRTNPEREGYAAGGSFGVETNGAVPIRATLTYDNVQYTSYLDSTAGGADLAQQQVQLQGAGTIPIRLRPRFDVRYRRSWLGGDVRERTAFSLDAGATLALFRRPSLTAKVGGRLLTYEAPAALRRPSSPQTVGDASAIFISPIVDVEWKIAEGTRLHLRSHPQLGETSVHALYGTNPYAEHAPSLQPNLFTTNAEAGVTWSTGPVRLVAAGGYRYAPVYRSFALDSYADYAGLYDVNYNPARIFHGRGQIALQGLDGVQASLEVSLRDGELQTPNRDQAIPNFARVTADALVAVSFAGGNGYLEAQSHFESPRWTDAARTTRVGSYLTFGLESSYALTSRFEIVARAENLSSGTLTQWSRYPRPPVQVSAGLRLNW